jgi:beta-galactosidase
LNPYFKKMKKIVGLFLICLTVVGCVDSSDQPLRERLSINADWRFFKYDHASEADALVYDVRPDLDGTTELRVADAKPTEAAQFAATSPVLKPWVLPSANPYIKNPAHHYSRPDGNPGSDFPFVKNDFDDSAWQLVHLPHDWAIAGPFQTGWDSEVGGGMGRLPINGIGWYRKKIDIAALDEGKSIFLDIDGAMSHAIVWLNGQLVGGWPYGYNSFRLDLTPYVNWGGDNQLAIRIDNPNHSARWYSGAGIYRNVWLVKANAVRVGHWGTYVTTPKVSHQEATVQLSVSVENRSAFDAVVDVRTEIFEMDSDGRKTGKPAAKFPVQHVNVSPGQLLTLKGEAIVNNPKLWGPLPTQTPNLYMAVTTVLNNGKPVDRYETRFGIRSLNFDPVKGLIVNGERIQIKGVNQHHDLGALGAAFNVRAAQRQLEILREMGCNAIRMAHNPPAPELLELTDKMGFLVVNEIFDSWERKKTGHDFHLIFPDWWEPDTRAFVRRDRNCPSVIMWSFGNEVGEQYTDVAGADLAKRIHDVVKEEDPTRPTTLAMNFAKPDMPLPGVPDVIGLNYQGEGIRQDPEFEGTDRIRTAPQYNAFHQQFPNKLIYASETASAFSSRGVYLFPVAAANSSPTRDGRGGDSQAAQVSSYELYAVDFGSSADKVFGSVERHPFVAGEFVWTGWDYLGEPTPYYQARSSYTGIVDLAGFRKDRFYLYQSHWRPDYPMAHILPHWNWPERVGEVTPVHVFTSGDEAELFLNGKSLGKKKKLQYEYRLRWDDVVYEPGELKVVAYKDGSVWAENSVSTTGNAAKLVATADRTVIAADGQDLAFITVQVSDANGALVPRSNQMIEFTIDGPGAIVATDNGDATDMVAFQSHQRMAFNGLALVIVRSDNANKGIIRVKATCAGMDETVVEVESK